MLLSDSSQEKNIKIARETFRMLRPKNVHLNSAARRSVCCCTIHQNVEYARKAIHRISIVNRVTDFSFKDNESLCNAALCDAKSIKCTTRKCDGTLQRFPKLDTIQHLKCSSECLQNNTDCEKDGHNIKCQQFERVEYEVGR